MNATQVTVIICKGVPMSSDVLVNVGKSILMSETCVKRNLSRKAYIIFVTNATNVVSVKFSPKYEAYPSNNVPFNSCFY